MNKMRKSGLITAFILGSSIFMSAQKLNLKNLKEDVLDYGTIEKSSDGVRKIEVVNTGKKPLLITNVTSSCGCTVPDWSKEPIKPKKSGYINVKYNTEIVGAINKAITVNSNDLETPNKIIKIKGLVEDKKAATAVSSTSQAQ